MINYKKAILVSVLFLCLNTAIAQKHTIKINFKQGGSLLDINYKTNATELKRLDSLISMTKQDSILFIEKFEFRSSVSPEGSIATNKRIATERLNVITGIVKQKIALPDSLIDTRTNDTDWALLRSLVEKSDMVNKKEVIDIIDNVPEWQTNSKGKVITSRLNQLIYINQGKTYNDLYTHFFPDMRYAEFTITFGFREPTPEETLNMIIVEEPAPKPVEEKKIVFQVEETKPLFAIKTNLLYDAVTALNIELEVPIGDRWSVSGEWIFPWLKASKHDLTTQILSGHGAVKYWFGNRASKDVLTGWNLGLYGGAGTYDIQLFSVNGEQGVFFDFGLQAGYAHKISKSLRLEYSLCLGYLQNDYKKYDKINNTKYDDVKVFRYPWETKRREWLGPTSAKVSLVWMLNCKTNKKQGGTL